MGAFDEVEGAIAKVYKLIERLLSPDLLTIVTVAVAIMILAGSVAAIVSLEYVPLSVPMVGRSRTDQAVVETIAYAILIAAGFLGLINIEQAISAPRPDSTKLALGVFLVLFSLFFLWWIVFVVKGF